MSVEREAWEEGYAAAVLAVDLAEQRLRQSKVKPQAGAMLRGLLKALESSRDATGDLWEERRAEAAARPSAGEDLYVALMVADHGNESTARNDWAWMDAAEQAKWERRAAAFVSPAETGEEQ